MAPMWWWFGIAALAALLMLSIAVVATVGVVHHRRDRLPVDSDDIASRPEPPVSVVPHGAPRSLTPQRIRGTDGS